MQPTPRRRADDRARIVARIHPEIEESYLDSMRGAWKDVRPKIIRILAVTFGLALLAVLTLRHG